MSWICTAFAILFSGSEFLKRRPCVFAHRDITSVYLCLKLWDDANACGWTVGLVEGGKGGRLVLQCDLAKL